MTMKRSAILWATAVGMAVLVASQQGLAADTRFLFREEDPIKKFKQCAQVLPPSGETVAGPGTFMEDRGRVFTMTEFGEVPRDVCVTVTNLTPDRFINQAKTFGAAGDGVPNTTDIDPMDTRTYCYTNTDLKEDGGIYLGCMKGSDVVGGCHACWRVDEYPDDG